VFFFTLIKRGGINKRVYKEGKMKPNVRTLMESKLKITKKRLEKSEKQVKI
jgi:hypothetical protein